MTGDQIRQLVLEVSKVRNTGHVGSALSICEIMAAVFNVVQGTHHQIVLAKGHAALAYYAGLCLLKEITPDQVQSYCQDGTAFGVHTEVGQPGVKVSTGSLGMGLSIAVGMALADRSRNIYCICSDAELDEGSTWEAVMFAAHHKLKNICLIVDSNESQALGKKQDILNHGMRPALEFQAFGWDSWSCDGHDTEGLQANIQLPTHGLPGAIIARTSIGKGVPAMEDDFQSHYLPLSHPRWQK